MRTKALVSAAALGAMLATLPPAGSAEPAKQEIPFGYLMRDISCSGATHVLLNPCPPNAPMFYLAVPERLDADLLLGQNVQVRGTQDPSSPCPQPLVRVVKIEPSDVLPPCPIECLPGYPPPCPR